MTTLQLRIYSAALEFALGAMLGAGIGAWLLIFAIMGGILK